VNRRTGCRNTKKLELYSPMNFAINYSPQAAELVRNGTIQIDYFKTPPWPEMIAEAEQLAPVAVHFELGIGNAIEANLTEIERFLASTATRYVNIHLLIRPAEMPGIPVEERPAPAQREAVIERMLAGIQHLTAHFGAERVIAENIPFHPEERASLLACVEPEVISTVIEESNCGLLLDVSHARIAAHALGVDAHTYIESLPVARLCELHFTGIHNWEGYLMDHLEILEEDWPWLDWVLERMRSGGWAQAHMLAFEYGGTGEFFRRFSDPQVISRQVPRLYAMCHGEPSP